MPRVECAWGIARVTAQRISRPWCRGCCARPRSAHPLRSLHTPALAQTHEPAALGTDIPAQPIAPALAAFARQTGLQLVYVSGVIRNQKSHAVPAGLQAEDALGGCFRAPDCASSTSRRAVSTSSPPRPCRSDHHGCTRRTNCTRSSSPPTAARRIFRTYPITIQVLTGKRWPGSMPRPLMTS